jgi:biotin carboxyl carrier protein
MKKLLIKVNGNQYEVEVEEVSDQSAEVHAVQEKGANTAASVPAPKLFARKASAMPTPVGQSASAPESGTQVKCPMPGNILAVKVAVGDNVSQGDILLMLEAMKMENEIVAPVSGKIAAVQVVKGTAVNAGDLLTVIV